MEKHPPRLFPLLSLLLLSAVCSPALAQDDCDGCQEYSYQDPPGTWHYWHRFHPESKFMRACNEEWPGHQDCHTEWYEEASCNSHNECGGGGGSLMAVAGEVDRILQLLKRPDQTERLTFMQLLEERIRSVPALHVSTDGQQLIELRDCGGVVLTSWAKPSIVPHS